MYNQRPKYFILLFILMFSHLEHSWLLSPAGWWPHAVRDTQVAKHAVADVRNAVKYHHNNLNISKNTHLMIDLELSLTIATFLLFPEPVSQEDFRNEWLWLLLQSLLKVFFFFRLYPKILSALVPSPVPLDPNQNPKQSKIQIQVQLGLGWHQNHIGHPPHHHQ